ERALFRTWQRSDVRAVFFLDSIDEAKLVRVEDFYVALKRFANAIEAWRTRASIVVSARPNAGLPQRDRFEILATLGAPLNGSNMVGPKPQDGHFTVTRRSRAKGDDDPILIVRMQPLDRDRVLRLAEARIGKDDTNSFAAALDAAYAWDFARRP